MPGFARRNRLRPINSIKHVVDVQGAIPVATKTIVSLIKGVINPDLTTDTTKCEAGSKVFSLFLNVQVVATSEAALSNSYFILYKNPQGNIPAANIPNANATGAHEFRRQIFHTEMAMMADTSESIPIVLFKGVLKIPKVYQTMRQDDVIELQLFQPGTTSDFCVECIYKEIR